MAKTLYGTYSYTGAVQAVSLPAGIYLFELWGAQGRLSDWGKIGGKGGFTSGVLSLTETTTVNIYVGSGAGQGAGTTGGYNGGGNGNGAGGGGATDIRIGGTAVADRVLVAPGGGGQSTQNDTDGLYGAAGGPQGADGVNFNYGYGAGATQTTGYALWQGGAGTGISAGGGGGGYYGGYGSSANWGGGGGGSAFIGGANGYIPLYAFSYGAAREGDGLCTIYTMETVYDDQTKTMYYSKLPAFFYLDPGSYGVTLHGSQGGTGGNSQGHQGKGGLVSGNITIDAKTLAYIYCGGPGGYNGGGQWGIGTSGWGGGATDIRIGGTALADRVLVAAGGGGEGANGVTGGDGGGLEGGDGTNGVTGATQTDGGGPIAGTLGQGATASGYGAGGGGGYWGGGAYNQTGNYAGGGGGSSYYGGTESYPVTGGATTAGENAGTGYAVITLVPIAYSGTRGVLRWKDAEGNWRRVLRCR